MLFEKNMEDKQSMIAQVIGFMYPKEVSQEKQVIGGVLSA